MPEVFASNLSFNGEFIDLVKNLIGLSSSDDLYRKLCKIHKVHGIGNRIKNFVPSLNELLKLMPEMYTAERVKNNINPNPDLKSILEKSWELD